MKENLSVRLFVAALLLAAVILFEYGKSFDFYFVGDDFAFIEFVLKEKISILWKSFCFYHYYPLGLLLNTLPACFGIFEPGWFVAINFFLFLSCAIVVMLLYRKIVGSLLGGFLAALIYSTAVPNSEVIYWKTGNQTVAMTLLSLLALMFFIRYLEQKSGKAFLGCILMFIASMLCIEQGVVTFGILFLYDLIFYTIPQLAAGNVNRKHTATGFLLRHAVLICVPVLLTTLKLSLGFELSPFPFASRNWQVAPALALDTMVRLIDFNRTIFPSGAGPLAHPVLTTASLLFFLMVILLKRRAAGLFFLLTSFGSILTISIAAGGPNSRYFCLPLAFYACFLCLLIYDCTEAIVQALRRTLERIPDAAEMTMRAFKWIHLALYLGACLGIACAGLRGNLARRDYWETASVIEKNIVECVENLYLSGGVTQRVYLLNVPEHIWSKKYSIFYVSSVSIMPDLRHRLGKAAEGVELIASGNLFEMTLHGERVVYRALGWDKMMGIKDIKKLIDSGHLVLQFSPLAMTVIPLSA